MQAGFVRATARIRGTGKLWRNWSESESVPDKRKRYKPNDCKDQQNDYARWVVEAWERLLSEHFRNIKDPENALVSRKLWFDSLLERSGPIQYGARRTTKTCAGDPQIIEKARKYGPRRLMREICHIATRYRTVFARRTGAPQHARQPGTGHRQTGTGKPTHEPIPIIK